VNGVSKVVRVRSPRPAKTPVDPWRALGVLREVERTPDRGVVPAVTVFLAGAECPFTCVFCDLWRHTLDGPTPPGALPEQLRRALAEVRGDGGREDGLGEGEVGRGLLKLYNASNFFDSRAVPEEDDPALLALASPWGRTVVECHPRLVLGAGGRERCRLYAETLGPGRLEVALGLETVHPRALPRLGKAMTLGDFDRAVDALAAIGVSARAFVLVGAPFVPAGEGVEWALRTAEHAFARGVGTVSLIPLRGGNGEMASPQADGTWEPPTLADLERALEGSLALAGPGRAVAADLWDLDRFATCPSCLEARRQRLARINLSGESEPRIGCEECGGE